MAAKPCSQVERLVPIWVECLLDYSRGLRLLAIDSSDSKWIRESCLRHDQFFIRLECAMVGLTEHISFAQPISSNDYVSVSDVLWHAWLFHHSLVTLKLACAGSSIVPAEPREILLLQYCNHLFMRPRRCVGVLRREVRIMSVDGSLWCNCDSLTWMSRAIRMQVRYCGSAHTLLDSGRFVIVAI